MDQEDYHGRFELLAAGAVIRLGTGTDHDSAELSAASLRLEAQAEPPDGAPVTLQFIKTNTKIHKLYTPP